MKYIDADKLIVEIEKWSDGKLTLSLLTEIKGIIAALQQKQLDENEAIEKNRIDAALIGFHLACGNGDKTIGECIEFWKPIIITSLRQEQPEVDLEKYLSAQLFFLGADLIRHKPYSFNRGMNVGMTKAYDDILKKINARKEE